MEKKSQQCNLEIWGGIECTINRVENQYLDQLKFTGHYKRSDDIERLASLGIEKIRYPVLWEYHQPRANASIDWTWSKRQLEALRSHNVMPIVGLVHHGSGPLYTNLLCPSFADGLAKYGAQVARQFPWVEYYTPVNEPLTTARFSGLYGHWYPHSNNDFDFLTMLLNQLKAVVLTMREIRKVNTDAKLVQTEDLSKTYSTPLLQYQANFENKRRWLSFDLLAGRVTRNHNLWEYLLYVGLKERDIMFFHDNPCEPDIAGFNYYPTSERYLDQNISLYSTKLWGGNGRHQYVDTEAIRIDHKQPSGIGVLLKEASDRLKLPLAVTEVFLSCTQEEQVRWLHQVWTQCKEVKDAGADIRAVTFWALLGEHSWNTLVTTPDGEYEAGAFDVRSTIPEPTLIAHYIKTLATTGTFNDPVLEENGWWCKEDRYFAQSIPCISH